MYCHKARAQASQRANEGKQAHHKHTDTDAKANFVLIDTYLNLNA